jgi:hypothetical protein
VTSKQDGVDQLRSTAEEAERFLQSLDEEADSSVISSLSHSAAISKPADYVGLDESDRSFSSTATGNDSAQPAIVLLIIAMLLSPLVLLVVWRNGEQSSVQSLPTLRYASSCGSPPGAAKRWWPVLGPPDRNLLRIIRDRYCGDAYITAEGSLQVASFDSVEEAERFRRQLQKSTGAAFRVGEGVYRYDG